MNQTLGADDEVASITSLMAGCDSVNPHEIFTMSAPHFFADAMALLMSVM